MEPDTNQEQINNESNVLEPVPMSQPASQTTEAPIAPLSQTPKNNSKWIIIITSIILILGGGYFAYTKFMTNINVKNNKEIVMSNTEQNIKTTTNLQNSNLLEDKKYNYYISFENTQPTLFDFEINGLTVIPTSLPGTYTQPIIIDKAVMNGVNSVILKNSTKSDGVVRILRTSVTSPKLSSVMDIKDDFIVQEFKFNSNNIKDGVWTFNFKAESNVVFPWLSGQTITETPELRSKVIAKSKEVYDAYYNKDKNKIISLFVDKNYLYEKLQGKEYVNQFNTALEKILSGQRGEIQKIDWLKDDLYLNIIANGKMVSLSTEKDQAYPVIYYYNEATGVEAEVPFYMMINNKGDLEIVY